MGTLWEDTRYGLRILRKNLRFAVVAVLTLGIGLGAIFFVQREGAALFSHSHLLLLLPFQLRPRTSEA